MSHPARSRRRHNVTKKKLAAVKQQPLPLLEQLLRRDARAKRLEEMNAGVPIQYAQNR